MLRDGFSPWLDEEDLLPGQDLNLEIKRAVRIADVVLVCLSTKAVDKEGYLQKEIRLALDVAEEKPEGTIFIIPLKLEECLVPDRLSQWQWLRYTPTQGYQKLVRSLVARQMSLSANVVATTPDEREQEHKAESIVRLIVNSVANIPEGVAVDLIHADLGRQSITLSSQAIRRLLLNATQHRRMMKHTSDESSGMPF